MRISKKTFFFRREAEHNQMVRSIYEEMENQVREEREKHLAEVLDLTRIAIYDMYMIQI